MPEERTSVMEVLKHDFWGTPLNPPEGYITHKSWRPLITLMYAAEWQLCSHFGFAGTEMKPMRLLSCLVHSLNAALMLAVLLQARIPLRWAGLGAALFAVHPVHIENIVYLVGRADSLSTTFYLLAILFLPSLKLATERRSVSDPGILHGLGSLEHSFRTMQRARFHCTVLQYVCGGCATLQMEACAGPLDLLCCRRRITNLVCWWYGCRLRLR